MAFVKAISLQDAAERLGVHYMTVYRYVRLGRLPARKVGGVWEIEVADLAGLRRGLDRRARSRRPAAWSKRLESRLIVGDEAGSWGVVESALASGSDPAEIYTKLLGPALRSVGERWAKGDLSVSEEHLASAVAVRLIGRLGPRFARPGRRSGRVIVATPPGERHAIPGAMVADLLRGAGFDVTDLGADVPADELAGAIGTSDGLIAVCLAATAPGTERAIRRSVKAVHKAADAPVVLGGAAVTGADHAADLGADHYARTMPDAVALLASLLESA